MGEFSVTLDPDHGGRWTSLIDPAGRQWLWERPDPARNRVLPGATFVDVGGIEECFPTLGDNPDHGELWTRRWQAIPGPATTTTHRVSVGTSTLTRSVRAEEDGVTVEYSLIAVPGTGFIWAAHALLELAVGARILAAPGSARAWPDHSTLVETSWPNPLGIAFDELVADDGSAMFCLLPGRGEVAVQDASGGLRFRLESPGQPVSVGLWRNLGGYPRAADERYRNIGIEPMLGNVFDVHAAGPGDLAVVPDSGEVSWTLRIDNC